jgi:hypothetical protein
MKAFSKLGLLLALVIAGRYLRLTEPAVAASQQQTAARVDKADTLRFASYAATKNNSPARPANQLNTAATPQPEPTYLIWY